MKIPFDIKYRPQIESGEYKVETFSGYPVTIYQWDFDDGAQTPIMGSYVFEDGKEYVGAWNDEGHFDLVSPNDLDLFLVTPEEELTPFEEKLIQFSDERNSMECDNLPEDREGEILADHLHRKAAELLAIAKQQLLQSGELLTQEHHEKLMETQ